MIHTSLRLSINASSLIFTKHKGNRQCSKRRRFCFRYAITSALYPVNEHFNRSINYSNCFNNENVEDIEYPVNPHDNPLIEQRLNISINHYSYFDDIG